MVLEQHMTLKVMMMLLKLYIKRFSLLILVTLQLFFFGQGNLFHVAWQGNFEQWILNPLKVKPIAHGIWDPTLVKQL
jgi:photosystem I P700 chlorophyll a apoprotein A2